MYHGFAGNGGPTLLWPLGVFDLKRFELSCCCSFSFPFCFLAQAVEGACAWPAASGGAAPGRHPRRACDQTHARGQDRAGGPWQVGRVRAAASAGGGAWTKRSEQAWLAEFEDARQQQLLLPAVSTAEKFGRQAHPWPPARDKHRTQGVRENFQLALLFALVCSWLYCRPTAARACVEHQQA